MLRFERILCPVDFFPASLRAFDYAVKLAANYEASVHALHVVAPVIPGAYGSAINVADHPWNLHPFCSPFIHCLPLAHRSSFAKYSTLYRIPIFFSFSGFQNGSQVAVYCVASAFTKLEFPACRQLRHKWREQKS